MSELRDCPCCGGDTLVLTNAPMGNGTFYAWCGCKACGVGVETDDPIEGREAATKYCTDRWNRRAPLMEAVALLESILPSLTDQTLKFADDVTLQITMPSDLRDRARGLITKHKGT